MPNLLQHPQMLEKFIQSRVPSKTARVNQNKNTKRQRYLKVQPAPAAGYKRVRRVRVLYDKNHNVLRKIPLEEFHYVKMPTSPQIKPSRQQRNLIQTSDPIFNQQNDKLHQYYAEVLKQEKQDEEFIKEAKGFLQGI